MDETLSEIAGYKKDIAKNVRRIKELEDNIDELQLLKSKIEKKITAMEMVSDDIQRKVQKTMSELTYPIRPDLFSGLLQHAKGSTYKNSITSLNDGISKTQLKINEYKNEISQLQEKNDYYSMQIHILESMKEG